MDAKWVLVDWQVLRVSTSRHYSLYPTFLTRLTELAKSDTPSLTPPKPTGVPGYCLPILLEC